MTVVISGDTGIDTVQAGVVGTAQLANASGTLVKLATESKPIGAGQSWSNVIGSRTSGVSYTNNTGRPITVAITTGGVGTHTLVIGGVTIASILGQQFMGGVVPAGVAYVATVTTPQTWAELS